MIPLGTDPDYVLFIATQRSGPSQIKQALVDVLKLHQHKESFCNFCKEEWPCTTVAPVLEMLDISLK